MDIKTKIKEIVKEQLRDTIDELGVIEASEFKFEDFEFIDSQLILDTLPKIEEEDADEENSVDELLDNEYERLERIYSNIALDEFNRIMVYFKKAASLQIHVNKIIKVIYKDWKWSQEIITLTRRIKKYIE